MSPLASGGSTRAKAKDDHVKAADISVRDVATATEYLIDGDLKSEDDEITLEFLSVVAMQLSQLPKLSTKKASEAFRALSYLTFDLFQRRTDEVVTDAIAKAISLATERVRGELDDATDLLASAVVTSNNAVKELREELREECRNVVTELKVAVEGVIVSLGSAEGDRKTGERGGDRRDGTESYADSVKRKVPAMHAMAVAKAELQKKRIRLVKASGMGGEGLGDLTEKQWVEKANIALMLMDGQEENRPEGITFVGVSKEKEDRGVIFEMNTGEAAGWLRDKAVMAAFLAKMGSTVDFKVQTYEVVVDWVPVTFEADQPAAWKRVEQSNGLREFAIKEVAWIKPAHLRSENQRTAIAIFRLVSREDANQVIENGLYVEGKKVWGRKQAQEPKRCLKCQCFGEHKAAKCVSVHEVCGRCGGRHRTSLCEENDKGKWECSNCRTAGNGKHKGHGAADRRCQIFLNRVDRMNKSRQENQYRFFCTTDPATWETYEQRSNEGQHTPDSHGQNQAGDKQGRGGARGRLGGGKRGEGGGAVHKKGENVGVEARTGGFTDNINGSTQTEAIRSGNDLGVRGGVSGNGGLGGDGERQEEGSRAFRQEKKKGPGPTQTTLSEMWTQKVKEKDLRSWSEDMEARLSELEKGSPPPLSYV